MPFAGDQAPPTPVPRRRSTRDRPAKAPLSEEVIVEAALAILRSEGPQAVSMRRVAASLDTGAASLYVYVSGRDGLLQAMLDRVTATIALEPPDPSRWRAQLHALLERLHKALTAHPGIASMTLADPPTTEAVLLLAETLLAILLAGQLDPQDAAWASDLFVSVVYAIAREDDVRHARDRSGASAHARDRSGASAHEDHAEKVQETLAGLPPDRFPSITSHSAQMVAGDSRERLRFAIDVVLDGLEARSARPIRD